MNTVKFGPMPAVSLEVMGAVGPRSGLARAREAGFPAVGINAARSEFSPETLGASGARDLFAYLARNGLSVSWVSAGARGRFSVSDMIEEDVERASAVVELAGRLRARCALIRVGPLGASDSPAVVHFREALAALTAMADRVGVLLAFVPAGGDEQMVEGLLREFADAPAGRAIDPGAALFGGRDPVDEVALARRITAVRASDSSSQSPDLAPGEGRVPWRDFLAALAAADYDGYITVEFAERRDSLARAAKALSMLRGYTIS